MILNARPSHDWQPIGTFPEGEHVEFWWEHGEKGNGGMEMATAFREDGSLHGETPTSMGFWTHGGPNSGMDFDSKDGEIPTHWRYPRPGPNEAPAGDGEVGRG